MRSSIYLISLKRVVFSTWNKWQHIKKWDVVSGANLHSHRRLRKSWKLCLYLGSFKWMKPNQSLVNSCIPMELWIPNVLTCFGQIKLKKSIFKGSIWRHDLFIVNINVKFVPFSYEIWKERILKILCPAVKRWDICVISNITKMINWWN